MSEDIHHGSRWFEDYYKFFGPNGCITVLRNKRFGYHDAKVPLKVTSKELDEVKKMFEDVDVYPRGGLFV